MSEFKREERYIVVKISDFHPEQEQTIRDRLNIFGIPTRECVVVEHDWPIHEQVWNMVQRMAEGREQTELDPKMLKHFTCKRVDNAGGTPGFTLFMTKMGASHTYQLYQNEAEALHFNLGKALGINPDVHLARLKTVEKERHEAEVKATFAGGECDRLIVQLESAEEREQARAARTEELSDALRGMTKWQNHVDPEERSAAIRVLNDAPESSPKYSLARRDTIKQAEGWEQAARVIEIMECPKGARFFREGVVNHLRYKAEKLRRQAAGTTCQDEGCPHYGTPHAHAEPNDEAERLKIALNKVSTWVNDEIGNERQMWDFADQVTGYIDLAIKGEEPK